MATDPFETLNVFLSFDVSIIKNACKHQAETVDRSGNRLEAGACIGSIRHEIPEPRQVLSVLALKKSGYSGVEGGRQVGASNRAWPGGCHGTSRFLPGFSDDIDGTPGSVQPNDIAVVDGVQESLDTKNSGNLIRSGVL